MAMASPKYMEACGSVDGKRSGYFLQSPEHKGRQQMKVAWAESEWEVLIDKGCVSTDGEALSPMLSPGSDSRRQGAPSTGIADSDAAKGAKPGTLGLHIGAASRKCPELIIVKFDHGPVTAWNEAHPESAIQVGDRVVSVNGIAGSFTKLIQVLRSDEQKLKLKVRRPAEMKVTIGKPKITSKLGVELTATGDCIQVDKVKQGLVQAWNEAYPYHCVGTGDLIVEVNGVRGLGHKLWDEVNSATSLELTVIRESAVSTSSSPQVTNSPNSSQSPTSNYSSSNFGGRKIMRKLSWSGSLPSGLLQKPTTQSFE
jgi:hypothetical protein